MVESFSWSYLEGLRGVELHRLYKSPPSALAVFRKVLSGLAKHFVMSMLYNPRPLSLSEFELMVKNSSTIERLKAIEQLRKYHIIKDVGLTTGKAIALVPDFARSLRQVLGGGGKGHSFGQVTTPPPLERVPIEELDDFARVEWEGILGFMVNASRLAELQRPGEEMAQPSQTVIELLRHGELIRLHGTSSRGQSGTVTEDGFTFVLKDVNTQVWTLLFLYVENAEKKGMDKIEVLSFIFFIASLELGLAYSMSTLTDVQREILWDFLNLGIVYLPDEDSKYFYPTRLATTLTSSNSSAISNASKTLGSSLQSSGGYIVIETNFRVYAYTSSPLQIALLNLFINLRSRHPNMVTGKMTKLSVQKAIRSGITAQQIISYLTSHAHPQMRRAASAEYANDMSRYLARKAAQGDDEFALADSSNPEPVFMPVPSTICNQITLWQMERDRIKATQGYLLQDFTNQTDYNATWRHADETGVLVWRSRDKIPLQEKKIFVNRIEGVSAFIAERKERMKNNSAASAG